MNLIDKLTGKKTPTKTREERCIERMLELFLIESRRIAVRVQEPDKGNAFQFNRD